jgi:DNA-binding transcriptional LysR family regulator
MSPFMSGSDSHDPISIRQLAVFVALVEHQSFTKAARQVGLSQSTVSGHIADLERRLDVLLVERSRGGVRPTAAGEALLPHARQVLRAEEGARDAVRELSGLVQGRLVVGASTIPASYILPSLFAGFHERYPSISLRVSAGDSGEILDRLRGAELELGIIGAEPDGAELDSFPIGQDRLLLVVAAGHKLANGKPVTAAELCKFPLVQREQGSGTRAAADKALRAILRDAPGDDDPFAVVCETGSTESQRASIVAGLGPGILSDLAAASELESGRLVEVPLRKFDVSRSFHLVSRPDAVLSPAARAFVEMMRSH